MAHRERRPRLLCDLGPATPTSSGVWRVGQGQQTHQGRLDSGPAQKVLEEGEKKSIYIFWN